MAPKGKKKISAKKSVPQPPTTTAPPTWPKFKPPLPITELQLEPLLPGKVVLARSFWPRSLCREYVSFLRELPLTTTPGKPKRGEAVRVNDRFQVDDFAFACRLWNETGLSELAKREEYSNLWGGELVGLNPNIRVYRYSQGQFFDCHYDDYNFVTLPREADLNAQDSGVVSSRTTWTLLLYLTSATEGCQGGETVFYLNDRQVEKEAITVSLETGMLLLHKHGDDCMLHEGREVTKGEKWVLRSDLCIRR